MKTVALIANDVNWITQKNKNFGGGNVVAYNIFKYIKDNGYEITLIGHGDKPDEENGKIKIKYINKPVNTKEFSAEAHSEAKKSEIIINFMTQALFDGVILQSHSFLYRTTRTNKFLIPLKRFLYKKKIDFQKIQFDNDIKFAYAVSKGIKEDYEKNLGLKDIKVSYPGCYRIYENFNNEKNETLTFGLIANSSINKSGNYCIMALGVAKLFGLKFKFNMIAPKYEKDILMKFLINIFGLKKLTTILPKQEDMSEFYKSIDCLIMPSIHESFGLAPLEAMSFCKTCLVSDNIGFAELIDENSGFKFNRLSFISFIKAIFKVGNLFYKHQEQYNKIRKAGWEVSLNHSWEDFVKGLLK